VTPVETSATPAAPEAAPTPVEKPVTPTTVAEAAPTPVEPPSVAEIQPPLPQPPTPATTAQATEVAALSDPLVPMDAPLPRPRPVIEKETPQPAAKPVKRTPAKKPAPVRRAAPQPAPAAPAPEPSPLAPFFASGGPPAASGSVAQRAGRGAPAGTGGSGGVNKDAQGRASVSSYRAKAYAHLSRFRSYPAEARRQGIRGTATVSFTLDANGRVLRASLARSSGSALLDKEAVAMVRRASPFPPIPAGIGATTTIRAPVNFAIGR
jgi:protein TonB